MKRQDVQRTAAYIGLLAAAFVLGAAANWRQLDNYAYDFLFRLHRPAPAPASSVILDIDEATLASSGGMRHIRAPLAAALKLVSAAEPKVVAVDVILTDLAEPEENRALAAALCDTPNLVLSSVFMDSPVVWEDPRPEFARCAAAIGHVYAEPDEHDSVTRSIPLVKRAGRDQRWAISLAAFALARGVRVPTQSPSDIEVAGTVIPTRPGDETRLMRVHYLSPEHGIPRVGMKRLLDSPALAREFAGKAVFVGVTAPTEVRDKLFTPYARGQSTSGIEIHANAFETMAQHLFITDVAEVWVVLFALALTVAAGLAFRYLPGVWAYAAGAAVLLAPPAASYIFFAHGRVFSFWTPALTAWLATLAAAGFYHLVVRRDWRREQSTRERYQQAMHFVTHEMRTPLSAIQGSSELISRYALTEEKRKQVADLINSESKRLARMVEIFLSVERLSAGQMELKHESVPVKEMLEVCMARTAPLAGRKHIGLTLEPADEALRLTGDRELIEYACYNLLTNAVKYSPQRTEVTVSAAQHDGHLRIAVRDQGIGMDQQEAKRVFQKFYRTRKAEESGEAGTGIGLSIVQQIVEQHGGRVELESRPGAGSCFTIVLPAVVAASPPAVAERH